MRNTCILLGLLAWLVLIVVLSLAKQWALVASLLAGGGIVEILSHNVNEE